MELIPFTSKDLTTFVEMSCDMYDSPAVAHPVDKNVFISTFRACLAGNQHIDGRMIVENGHLIPEARGQHIGRSILEALSSHYHDKVGALKLECTPENQVAMRLYQSLGFQALPYTAMVWELPNT